VLAVARVASVAAARRHLQNVGTTLAETRTKRERHAFAQARVSAAHADAVRKCAANRLTVLAASLLDTACQWRASFSPISPDAAASNSKI